MALVRSGSRAKSRASLRPSPMSAGPARIDDGADEHELADQVGTTKGHVRANCKPIEWPTSTTGPPTDHPGWAMVGKWLTMSACCSTLCGWAGRVRLAAIPKPGKSGATTVPELVRTRATRLQDRCERPTPCSSTLLGFDALPAASCDAQKKRAWAEGRGVMTAATVVGAHEDGACWISTVKRNRRRLV